MNMNVELNETVTLTRGNYEAMKNEIADLREQIKQKTIIVEVKPDWYDYLKIGAIFLGVMSFGVLALQCN